VLTSLQNPLVKQLRKLHRAKDRREQGVFLLEGTHLLEEACLAGCPLETVCYTADWGTHHERLRQTADELAQRSEWVSPEVLQAIATTVQPDGVVATVERRLAHPHPPRFTSLGLVLETIQDPGNLGTLIRTAAAAGAEGLMLSADSTDLDNPKVLRASAGQWFRLPMAVNADLPTAIADYKAQGWQIVATLPGAQQTYWQIDWRQPSLILLGNEGAGLSPDLSSLADRQVTIPLSAGVESLNVAIAGALILYEAKRQRESTVKTYQNAFQDRQADIEKLC
jgi:TrmH family RNA methyltransferase